MTEREAICAETGCRKKALVVPEMLRVTLIFEAEVTTNILPFRYYQYSYNYAIFVTIHRQYDMVRTMATLIR